MNTYLKTRQNKQDKSSIDNSREVSEEKQQLIYVPPHKRNCHNHNQIIEYFSQQECNNKEDRSKSFDPEHISKKQNTFGFANNEENKSHLMIQLIKNQKSGFTSPKFKFNGEDPIDKTFIELSSVEEVSINSSNSYRIVQMGNKVKEKEKIIDEYSQQLQLISEELEREKKQQLQKENLITEQFKKQIELLTYEMRGYKSEINENRNEIARLRQQLRKKRMDKKNKPTLFNYEQQKSLAKCNNCASLNKEFQKKIELLMQQLEDQKHQLDSQQALSDSLNNNTSIIENQKVNDFSKNLGGKLNLTIDKTNNSFNNNLFMNQELLEGVKTLKNQSRENQKFIVCLKQLVISCAPQNYFKDNNPALKDIWKFIKLVLMSYIEGKKNSTQLEIIEVLCKYLVCNKEELCQKTANLVVENNIMSRIISGIRELFSLPVSINLREVEMHLTQFLKIN